MKFVDMHCDTISVLLEKSKIKCDNNLNSLRHNDLQLSLEKMKEADYLLQNFALFVNLKKHSSAYNQYLELLSLFNEEVKDNADLIRQVLTYEDIKFNTDNGYMSALLSVEEGEVCEGEIEKLEKIYSDGVRMMTLTWNYENSLAYPHNMKGGLKDKGIEFIKRMNELGMIIDVAHLNDEGIYDVLNYTSEPFVASHTNAKSICSHSRNLNDDLLKKLSERGCVVGINFYSKFLNDNASDTAYIEDISKHIKHMINIGGTDFIGLGSDYDGIDTSLEWGDCSGVNKIVEGLCRAGISYEVIEKICYKNVIELYRNSL